MSPKLVPAVFKTAAAAGMAWGYDSLKFTPLDSFIRSQKGGHLQFLTIQGLAVSFIAVCFGILASLTSIRLFHRLQLAVSLIALPLSITISLIYWTLLLFIPHLILRPKDPNTVPSSSLAQSELTRIPLSTDLALHALPAITMIIDFFLFEKRYPKSWVNRAAPLMCVAAGIGYSLWVEHCKSYNGTYPYPFLHAPTPIRVMIYAGATSLAYGALRLLNHLHP